MGSFPTEFRLIQAQSDVAGYTGDVLIVPVYQKADKEKGKSRLKKQADNDNKDKLLWTSLHQALDKAMGGHLLETLTEENFKGDCGKKRTFKIRSGDTLEVRWLVILGLGTPDKLDVKKATSAFCGGFKESFGFKKTHEMTLLLPEETARVSAVDLAHAAVFGAIQSTYKTREAGEDKIHKLKQVNLVTAKGQTVPQAEVEAARAMALGEAFTKDLANMPANLKTAESVAEEARLLGKLPGMKVEVESDPEKIRKEMPAFWAVAQGAAKVDPPRFIKLTYTPTGKIRKKLALVGKGVIFDTGGVQVKTGNHMNDMKFDMTGAASVLGAIKAAAELKLKGIQVSVYIAATRNLTGEEAYLPDSIINSANGKKIEIRHTDAEGRVTLADAVHKAVEDKPDEIVTIATLTGAAGIAVGHCIALMGTDDDLVNRIERSAKAVGETVQKLAFIDEDFDTIKSDRDAADLSNTGKSRNRGHMSAGAFVVSFAGNLPIAHLDIAGGDAKDGNATGIAVKGLVEYLRKEAS